jgi:hypothetical protein
MLGAMEKTQGETKGVARALTGQSHVCIRFLKEDEHKVGGQDLQGQTGQENKDPKRDTNTEVISLFA